MDSNRQQRERKFWDRFAAKYDPFAKSVENTYEKIITNIRPRLDKSSRILEIGAGTGIISFQLAPDVSEVHGCDISPGMIEVAKTKLKASDLTNVVLSVQDGYNLNYDQGSFDLVIISNVLHVMESPEKALVSVKRVLKSDGFLICPTYCHGASLKARCISFLMSLTGFRAHHKWTVEGFRRFLEEHQFHLEQYDVIADKIPVAFAVANCKGIADS